MLPRAEQSDRVSPYLSPESNDQSRPPGLSPISNPEVEVYVLDESSAMNVAIKMTWSEVKEFHAKRSQGYIDPE